MALKKIVEVIFRGQSEKKEKLPGASKLNQKKTITQLRHDWFLSISHLIHWEGETSFAET